MENETRGPGGIFGVDAIRAKTKEWYQILFVPYAIIFIPYTVLGTVAAGVAFYSGADPNNLKFKWIPLGIFLFVVIVIGLAFLRWKSNRQARLRSFNKSVRVLEEQNGLHFRESGEVDYCSSHIISPVDGNTSRMTLFLEWHGSLDDIKVEEQDGCKIAIAKAKETSGINIIADFSRILPKGCIYPFSFILRFDNSSELIRPFLKKVVPPLPENLLVQFLKFENNAPTRFVEAIYPAGHIEVAERETYKVVQGGYHDYPVPRPRQGKSYKIAVSE
jgi:hypothetical protein